MGGFGPGEGPDPSGAPAGIRLGQRVELEIGALAYGGAGVARLDGFVVLVDRVLPGERVKAEITRLSRRFARARLVEVCSPSSQRREAPCSHDPVCGGCAYQALAYPLQLEAKGSQVRELLERIGRIPSPFVAPPLAAPEPFRYRWRMSYEIPTAEGAGPGLHLRADSSVVLEVPGCLLPEPGIQAAYERLLQDLRWLKTSRRPGHLVLQAGSRSAAPVALLRGDGSPSREVRRLAVSWVEEKGVVVGVVWHAVRGRPLVLAGVGEVEESLSEFHMKIPPGCFFQANPPLASAVFEEIASRCGEEPESILELYSGVGALTHFLARGGRRVVAVEGNSEAVRVARENGRLNRSESIQWIQRDVRDALVEWGAEGKEFDNIIVDPPRSGLPPGGGALLSRMARRRIHYLSCDPSTLARDLRSILAAGGWKLERALPVDFFPQTAEIECLAELSRL